MISMIINLIQNSWKMNKQEIKMNKTLSLIRKISILMNSYKNKDLTQASKNIKKIQ